MLGKSAPRAPRACARRGEIAHEAQGGSENPPKKRQRESAQTQERARLCRKGRAPGPGRSRAAGLKPRRPRRGRPPLRAPTARIRPAEPGRTLPVAILLAKGRDPRAGAHAAAPDRRIAAGPGPGPGRGGARRSQALVSESAREPGGPRPRGGARQEPAPPCRRPVPPARVAARGSLPLTHAAGACPGPARPPRHRGPVGRFGVQARRAGRAQSSRWRPSRKAATRGPGARSPPVRVARVEGVSPIDRR